MLAVLTLSVVIIAPLAPLQDPQSKEPPTETGSPKTDAKAAATGEAAAILAAARQAQGGQIAGNGIKSFDAALLLEFYDEKGHANVVDVQRKYRIDGSMVTRLADETSGAVTLEGTDGKTFWLSDRHGVTRYDKAEFKDEKDRIREQVELMGLLARIVLVKGLERELTGLRRLPDAAGQGLSSQVVEGVTTWPFAGKRQSVSVRLWIQARTHHVLGVRIQPLEGEAAPLQICFWDHEANEQGVLVPGSIKIYQGTEGAGQRLTAKMYLSRIVLNPALPDELFQVPTE